MQRIDPASVDFNRYVSEDNDDMDQSVNSGILFVESSYNSNGI